MGFLIDLPCGSNCFHRSLYDIEFHVIFDPRVLMKSEAGGQNFS